MDASEIVLDPDGTAPPPGPLPVRRVAFRYPDDTDPMWVPHQREFAAAANAISLGMPHAEPLFIRAVRSTFDRLDDDLRARSESYIRQETGHHTQHKRFNDLITARYPGLQRVDRMMKANTYDVFEATDGSRLRYAWAALVGLVTIGLFTLVGALVQLHGERRLRHPMTWWQLGRLSLSLAWVLLPTLVVSSMPGHHPDDFADPVVLPAWLKGYDPATETMPLWGQG